MPCLALGIDPGFASLGFAVVEIGEDSERVIEMDVVRTSPATRKRRIREADDNVRRAGEIVRALRAVFVRHKVTVLCCESMSFPRGASAAAKLAMAWGVVVAIALEHDVPILQATPKEIKKSVTGRKTASKEEVRQVLEETYGGALLSRKIEHVTACKQEHAFDGLAAVVSCLESETIILVRKLL
ncbi:hypothetical protein LCGC14_0750250 [marine sediment metagenome]|uniref:Uncharacterized protein n=1 Tax=marine sediment metagenome TaxID=412755 RepID=A0A0F9QP44_9ZZZZ